MLIYVEYYNKPNYFDIEQKQILMRMHPSTINNWSTIILIFVFVNWSAHMHASAHHEKEEF